MPVLINVKEFVKLQKICNTEFVMTRFRIENDIVGSRKIPKNALYGIHALRAKENFPDETGFPIEWFKSVGLIKQACYETCQAYSNAVIVKYPGKELPFRLIPGDILS